MKKENIIFDLDGTLINSAPSILNSILYALDVEKIKPIKKIDNKLIGPPLLKIFQYITRTKDKKIIPNLIELFKFHYDSEGYKKTIPFENIEELLIELKNRKYNLFIATNKRIVPTKKIIELLNWNYLFDGIYTLDETKAKGKKEILKFMLEENKQLELNSIYIGDTLQDLEAAESLDLPFVFVTWGYGFGSINLSNTYIIDEPYKLIETIELLNKYIYKH